MKPKYDALKRLEKCENVNKTAFKLNFRWSTMLGWRKKKTD
jgi:hypothetical protein